MIYDISVTWQESGILQIEADSLDEAIKIAECNPDEDDKSIELPKDSYYVDGSWVVDPREFQETLNE